MNSEATGFKKRRWKYLGAEELTRGEVIWEWFVTGVWVYLDGKIETRWNFGDELT